MSKHIFFADKMRLLVPLEINDDDMACGGRERLDASLRRGGETEVLAPSVCMQCSVSTLCILGLARVKG